MSNRIFPKRAAGAIALAAFIFTAPAFAGVQSFVSVKGTDAGTCASAAAPCRTFAYAHNQTNAGGEILALDAGDYGPVTIAKSLSITGAVAGAGVRGGVAVGAAAISVTAGASDVVDLTGLTLDGLNGDQSRGISISSAGAVTVKHCVIRNFYRGMQSDASRILVEDTAISNSANDGININSSIATGILLRVSSSGAGASGVAVFGGTSRATIAESSFTQNRDGIHHNAGFPTNPPTRLYRNLAVDNTRYGLFAFPNAVSAGNNFVHDNGTNILYPVTNVGTQ